MSARVPTIGEIMAAAGIGYRSAWDRLDSYKKGLRPLESLFAPRGYGRGNVAGKTKERDWGDLGLGPRKRIEDIPGPTELERRMYGR